MQQTVFIQLTKEELLELISSEVNKAITKIQPKEQKYYTRKEVCEHLRITMGSLYNYIRQGKLHALKLNGRTLFDASLIDEAVEKKTVLKYGRA